MMYWKNDLSDATGDDLPNQVPLNARDNANWQHMVTYGVSFGVDGTLDRDQFDLWNADPDLRKYPLWPSPFTGSQNRKIDDLWHASVSGRGEFLSAANPQELVTKLRALLQDVMSRVGSGASVSINGEELYAGTRMFQSEYSSDDWSGDVHSYTVDQGTQEVQIGTPVWSASAVLGEGSDWDLVSWNTGREMVTYSQGTNTAMPFRWASITGTMQSQLNFDPIANSADSRGEHRLEYIRGNNALEERFFNSVTNPNATFRNRSSKIGDIVHSSPLFREYEELVAGVPNIYGVLFVGGNAGGMHALDADTGRELFFYIPGLVFQELIHLPVAPPYFTHHYYVDLTPFVRQVGTETFLVGGLGKGGKGYFCLDVTNPRNNTEANAASWVKWEYPRSGLPTVNGWDHGEQVTNMGYSFSQATIVKTNDPSNEWVVIFGNGYGSHNQDAVLYVVNLATGNLVAMIPSGACTADSDGDGINDCIGQGNGLSSPTPVDINGDFKVDYVFAGDLHGNMWKYDLTSSNPNNWGFSYGLDTGVVNGRIVVTEGDTPRPLFQAMGREKDAGGNYTTPAVFYSQPITTRPLIIRHPDSSRHGYLVLFGTGKYLGLSDLNNTDEQSVYGIWDYGDDVDEYLGSFQRGATAELSNQPATVSLLEQEVIWEGPNPYNADQLLRVWSEHEPIWGTQPDSNPTHEADPTDHVGWYRDLPWEKERVIRQPLLRDYILVMDSHVPRQSPCSGGGETWREEINAYTGGGPPYALFDINNDGVIDDRDMIQIPNPDYTPGSGLPQYITVAPGGLHFDAMLYPPVILRMPDGETEIKYSSTAAGTIRMMREVAEQRGLFYWIEIDN
jgi:type IV pilus assembly protein PilY1